MATASTSDTAAKAIGCKSELQKQLRHFLSVSSAGSLTAIGRSRPVWASYRSDELTDAATTVLYNIPSARLSVLNYVGLLVHEGVHLFLCQLENALSPDCNNIESAVEHFTSCFQQKLETDIEWQKDILNWSSELLSQISQRNSGRRSTSSGNLSELLRLYTSCRCSHSVAQLLNQCLQSLLQTDPEGCVSMLVESAKFGSHFDWVLSFAGTCFPEHIVAHLISVGLDEFSSHVAEMVTGANSMSVSQANQLNENYKLKFRSLSAILGHLAGQRGTQLKNELRKLVERALCPSPAESDRYIFAFIFRLLTCSQEVLQIAAEELFEYLTISNLLNGAKQMSNVPKRYVTEDDQPYPNYMVNFIMRLKEESLVKVFDKLVTVAFEQYDGDAADNMLLCAVKAQANCMLELILSNLTRQVHQSVATEPLILVSHVNENWDKHIDGLFLDNNFSQKYNFRLLCTVCVSLGIEKCSELLVKVLLKAQNDVQLASFPALCSVLRLFFSDLNEKFIEKLPTLREMFGEKDAKWIGNLHTLLHWENNAQTAVEYKMMGLSDVIREHYGTFCIDLLSQSLSSTVTNSIILLQTLDIIGSPPHQLPKITLNIVSNLVQLILESLRLCDSDDGIQLFNLTCSFSLQFLDSQASLARQAFLTLVLDRAIECHDDLFLPSLPKSPSKPPSNANRLLAENRSTNGSSVVSLVHSGIIGQGARKTLADNVKDLPILRRLLLVDLICKFCSDKRGELTEFVYNLDWTRQLSCALNERLCMDAVGTRHCWGRWEEEREAVGRFVQVAKGVSDITFAWDLLLLVAETQLCLWFSLPVIKAIFASILTQCENTVLKTLPVNRKTIEILDKWFLLAVKGQLIPERLTLVNEIIPLVSQLEAGAILLDVWNYLQRTSPDMKTVRQNFEYVQLKLNDKVESPHIDPEPYMENCRLVMQSNIAKLGYLFPKIFPDALK